MRKTLAIAVTLMAAPAWADTVYQDGAYDLFATVCPGCEPDYVGQVEVIGGMPILFVCPNELPPVVPVYTMVREEDRHWMIDVPAGDMHATFVTCDAE